MYKIFEKILYPFPNILIKPPPYKLISFILKCIYGVRKYILLVIFFTTLTGTFEALLFAAMGKIIDLLSNIKPSLLWKNYSSYILLLGFILISSTVFVGLQTLFKHQVLSGNFPMLLRWNFHRLILNQSINFFQEEFAGRIATKVMQTSIAIRDIFVIIGDILVFITIYIVTILTIIGTFNVYMLFPFVIWISAYIYTLIYFIPRLNKTAESQATARSLMTGRITDAYANIMTVKLFSHAGREANYARFAMIDFLKKIYQQMRLISSFEIINHLLAMLLILGTTGCALFLWTKGILGIGAVAAATAMSLRLNGISHWVMWEIAALFESIGTIQDGMNMLSKKYKIVDNYNAKRLVVTNGKIFFKNVSFSYDQKHLIINNLSLTIQPGEKIGLVGRSGAGKSTINNLLLRFYDIKYGEILIDGQNISNVSQESLREQIGMVTQDTSLLHRSIRDNILYGRPDASECELFNAAKCAEADIFIKSLTDEHGRKGYDAHVGEHGIKLSGGQRQRIAIARVILKNAPILLLDEATSALDSEAEIAIQKSLYNLMKGKTVIAIAHRLSTISAMDRLIVLDNGCVAEEGSHLDLLKKNGLYSRLWRHQNKNF
ncbi:ABC transporter ATP-binding protein [Candidatus Profftella armatura]|uniref:ABC transporter, ATP-binding/permease protein n=3 Tax=cellular organisms TaxID=131567 RepID=S5RM22_9PROT|nr:ABC transporter ATP-binding protein [Candidatus Profftella armatura]AGS06991.1 ABC transporter, ATP-binding/permease protein [Candidatus Profftella armatura]ALC96055.1 multidrug ABC transporter ATP-binding protein [Candidatus Profftella armatura]QLK13888.1 ABC transporter ATP-binding protein [Candidatus Profftella armatura]